MTGTAGTAADGVRTSGGSPTAPVRLFLSGDVMLGRGIDQVLPCPGEAALREAFVDDASDYVRLAERVNGPVPSPVEFTWPWGEALPALEAAAPDVRVVNLETSVTRQEAFAPGKGVHYRMSPANLPALTAASPDVCVLANNHVLDFGAPGLEETLDALDSVGLATAGAGRSRAAAQRPAAVPLTAGGRVLVYSVGSGCSGIPPHWAATNRRPGVERIAAPSRRAAEHLAKRTEADRRDGDVVVVSVHFGSNWGYDVAPEQREFAHQLIDGGVDLVHGHSSHHPRPIEVYRERLILYGCGDLINDYEGIAGHEGYRSDLRALFLVDIEPATGSLVGLRVAVLQARRLRLQWPPRQDAEWLCRVLDERSRLGGSQLGLDSDGAVVLR